MNIRPYVIINGVSSQALAGLLVTKLPPITKPLQRVLQEEIDGRDGDIITPLGFSAVDKPLEIALTQNYDVDEVINYFNSEGVITFSNEPEKYYRFKIYEQIDFEKLIRFKTATVNIHCQPFKFSTIETEQVFNNPTTFTINNAGNYNARPVITLTGSGNVTVSLNGSNILSIAFGDVSQTIIIDSENMNAYGLDNTLLNRLVTGNYDKIRLKTGANTITVSGAVTQTKLKNYSRWV